MNTPPLDIRPMSADDRAPVLDLWERSVRATHHFLAEGDIVCLRPEVAAALASDALSWWVLVSPTGARMGFLGFADPTIEALFLDPDHFRFGRPPLSAPPHAPGTDPSRRNHRLTPSLPARRAGGEELRD